MSMRLSQTIVFMLLILPFVTYAIPTQKAVTFENEKIPFLVADEESFSRGPTVNLVTNNSATIFWRTPDMTNASISFGLNQSLLSEMENSTLDTDHIMQLTGLLIGETYYYQVESNGTESNVYHFKTAPADGEPFKMICLGDNRPGSGTVQPDVFSEIADMIISEEPNLVIMTGDFVFTVNEDPEYNEESWSAFTNISDRFGHYAPIYGVLGNHDTGAGTGSLKLEYFFDAFILPNEPQPYYSLDYAGVHFSFLDCYEHHLEDRITGTQYNWLVDDLSDSDAIHKFVFGHSPLFPVNHIGSALDVNDTEQDRLQQLFEDENVTAYISGHDHTFDRMTVNGVVHIITGGAGAPLYSNQWGTGVNHYVVVDVSSGMIDFKPKDLDSTIFRQYTLPYSGPIEISIRPLANTSTRAAGTTPDVYFSEVPEEYYFSWDLGTNSTTITGIPGTGYEHTLDIFAKNSESIWSHARYVFFTAGGTPPPTTTPPPDMIMIILLGAGLAIVVIVVVVVVIKKR